MLTFLRHIRRGILGSGQARKYFLYAAGEFILIVAGILVAMQINNWNEWRKDREKEIIQLTSITEDLEASLSHFNEVLALTSDQTLLIEQFATALETERNMDSLVLIADEYFDLGFWAYNIEPITSTFNEMLSSGRISIISDLTLRNNIIQYYEYIEAQTGILSKIYDATWEMDIFLSQFTDVQMLVPELRSFYLELKPELFYNVLNDNRKELARNTATHHAGALFSILQLKEMISNSQELKLQIDGHLNHLNN